MHIIGKTNINFIGARKYAFAASTVLVIIGLFAFIQTALGRANLGVDFAGGTSILLKFEKPVPIDAARALLKKNNLGDTDLQEFAQDNRLLIKLKKTEDSVGKLSEEVLGLFSAEFKANKFEIESRNEIGPKVGKKLKNDAIWAVVVSMICIIIYIAWRFEFRFGVAAAVATFHDALAIYGLFHLLGKEINLLLITALLTLLGYSLTDTVVVFDRIRENMRKRIRDPLQNVFNDSINEVLSRTIVTSLTVLLVTFALIIFGSDVTRDFSLAMFFGVIIGTYSSIFVASPIVFIWPRKKGATTKLLKKH